AARRYHRGGGEMSPLSRRRFLQETAAAASAALAAPGILASAHGSMDPKMSRRAEAMEDALALLASTGPEYAGRLANHGPMAAEALVVMDRPDAVVPWVEQYRKRLHDHPAGTRPIDRKDWREALGADDRVGDWIVFFRRELAEHPWKAVLAEWTARLSPGVVAAAFHGAIRTAHAVRSLEAADTPARVHELAEGLGYWAATYHALPEAAAPAKPPAGRRPSQAIAGVPTLPPERRISYGNITDRLSPLDGFPPFAAVADAVDASGDPSAFLTDLTETFASVYLATAAPGTVITFLHGVTGPVAVRTLLPYVSPPEQRRLSRYAWQAAASFYASAGGKTGPPLSPDALPTRDELADRAIASGDEHAIKFTEACFREYARNPKPVYVLAARDGVARLS
ncbi:MAG: questin oxidase family protein, partial [Acidobacteriota bacterium]